ncbi:MAG TPA: VOC family protein [Nitrospirota bacterium]|nr:VOC family protein [Nitrospirota bacterium]
MSAGTVQTNPVQWFEIPVKDLDRAKKFYEALLGVKLSINEMGPLKMAWFPMVQDGPGATGSLVKAENYVPSQTGTVVYFSVEDVEEALRKVEAGGGKRLMPKTSIGEYGFIAHFTDTEGNRLAFHSRK